MNALQRSSQVQFLTIHFQTIPASESETSSLYGFLSAVILIKPCKLSYCNMGTCAVDTSRHQYPLYWSNKKVMCIIPSTRITIDKLEDMIRRVTNDVISRCRSGLLTMSPESPEYCAPASAPVRIVPTEFIYSLARPPLRALSHCPHEKAT